MRKTILTALAVCLCTLLRAQGAVDSLYFDARGSFHQEILDGKYSSNLRADFLNLQIFGHINDKLSYRIRQRLNVGIDKDNPFRATDWMCLTWQATPKWKFYAGKTSILIGGYEYDSVPIDVYYYSQFCSNLYQYFAFSVNAGYEFRPGQSMVFQICNSPLSSGFGDTYAYNLAWTGHFTRNWQTIWSFNLVEDPYKRMMNYIALGNHWTFGNLMVDLDLFHRASFSQKNYFFTDYSLVSKIIWRVGDWNLCTKFGYETNAAENVDGKGISYDTVLAAGTDYFYGGAGVEYFPLGNENVRLHLAYFRDSFDHRDNIQLGLKWKFYVINNSSARYRK